MLKNIDINNPKALLELANRHINEGDYIKAIGLLEILSIHLPSNLNVSFILYQCYKELNQEQYGIRILKSQLGNYPNNERLLDTIMNYYKVHGESKAKRELINDFVSTNKGVYTLSNKKVLWVMSFSIYPPSKLHDFLLTKSLQLRGCEVQPLICGRAQIGECNVFGGVWGGFREGKDYNEVSSNNCNTCVNHDTELWEDYSHLTPDSLSDFITDEIRKTCKEILNSLDDDYANWSFGSLPLGQWALDVLRNNEMLYNENSLDNLIPRLKHYVNNILLVHFGFKEYLNHYRPDFIISNDSYYYQWAVVEHLAKNNGIPFYNNWCGGRRMGWAYNLNAPSMELDFRSAWEIYSQRKLTQLQSDTVNTFIENRFKGSDMILNTATPESNSQLEGDDRIDLLYRNKPTALLVSNVIWDLAALNRHLVHSDMIDWIIDTVQYFVDHPEFQLIIKPHPGEEISSIPHTAEKVHLVVREYFGELPPNIVLLMPKSRYSVYNLIDKISMGIVFTTTVGLELACRGIPVISAGTSVYSHKGFTFEPSSKENYKELIGKMLLNGLDNPNALADRAKRFLYLYIFRYYSQLNLFDHTFAKEPLPIFDDGFDIVPGANSVLDHVCDSIIHSLPFFEFERIHPSSQLPASIYRFSNQDLQLGLKILIEHYSNNCSLQLLNSGNSFDRFSLNGFDFTVPSSAFKPGELEWIYNEVNEPIEHNPHAYCNSFIEINTGDVVLDLGACEGFFIDFALRKGAKKVYAFEPHPKLIQSLTSTFSGEKYDAKVEILGLAVGAKDSVTYLTNGNSFISEASVSDSGLNKIVVRSLDSLVSELHIQQLDFIKMDIEGEEINAVLGAVETIKQFRPKLSIAVYHSYQNAIEIKRILTQSLNDYDVRFGGCYMWEVPYRPFMLYAIPKNKTATRPKIIFTTPVLKFPAIGGPALRIENSIKALSNAADVFLISRAPLDTFGGIEGKNHWGKLVSEFHFAPNPNSGDDEAAERGNAAFVYSIAQAENISTIWCGFGNISFYFIDELRRLDKNLILIYDTDSVWSRFVLREVETKKNEKEKQQIILSGLNKELEEQVLVAYTNFTTAVSEIDADYYRGLTDEPHKVKLFSNVIDLNNYPEFIAPPRGFRTPALFVAGSFYAQTSPMVFGTAWLINEVLPIVVSKIPNVHLYIVGNGSQTYFKNSANVTVTGQVDSVLPYLCNSSAALVPLFYESGTRFKILEAGACKKAVVSTALGAEGIEISHGKDILIADTPIAFAESIIELINNNEINKQLGENLYKLISKNFSVNALRNQALEIFHSINKKH